MNKLILTILPQNVILKTKKNHADTEKALKKGMK